MMIVDDEVAGQGGTKRGWCGVWDDRGNAEDAARSSHERGES